MRKNDFKALTKSRAEIDRIDDSIIKLLKKRVAIVRALHAIKKKRGVPIRDRRREDEIILRLSSMCPPSMAVVVKKIYRGIFSFRS